MVNVLGETHCVLDCTFKLTSLWGSQWPWGLTWWLPSCKCSFPHVSIPSLVKGLTKNNTHHDACKYSEVNFLSIFITETVLSILHLFSHDNSKKKYSRMLFLSFSSLLSVNTRIYFGVNLIHERQLSVFSCPLCVYNFNLM